MHNSLRAPVRCNGSSEGSLSTDPCAATCTRSFGLLRIRRVGGLPDNQFVGLHATGHYVSAIRSVEWSWYSRVV